jgi:Fur family ferric uptake transcriptional regulator
MKSDYLLAKLKNAGQRITKVRQELLETLCSSNVPLNTPEILAKLLNAGLNPNKTTIYRELYFLRELGIVSEIVLRDGSQRYEINTDEHKHHLVCDNCGKVESVELEGDLDKIETKISKQTNFAVAQHDLTFYGKCDNCQ